MANSTIVLHRDSPAVARITYTNPPVNLITGDTVRDLAAVVDTLLGDRHLQVVVFDSGTEDFFYNHFDLAHLDHFPGPDVATGHAVFTDIVLRLSTAPFVTIGVIRGRTRGGGNELALAFDLRYASAEKAFFGQPEVGTAVVPGGGGTERLPRLIGHDRALEVILTSADYDASTAEKWGWVTRTLPDAELDSYVAGVVGRLASFDLQSLTAAKGMVGRASLPPTADLVAAYGEFEHAVTQPGFQARATATAHLTPQEAINLEYNLGAALGEAALRRTQE
ncbi:enoyl-CoA hydratase/isomerase family protein [Branchiibius sp. NY16-3462-2]|uniref:enoyl-CoA hydratase/isomerase family protein n=1 Tax=Branchiibius sp. NY16-3462-2 TaxID=1807500 RepID=UPI000798EDD5|nr:enoyl-CoA hydratase/isomerase family protein [Branchiibius sp. NY16-3462-2]KYH43657.1 enoyl-CoA hydratase [Branchiibius sp. NY16-3462-2]